MRRAIWILLAILGVFFIFQHDRLRRASAECPPVSTTPAQMVYSDRWLLQWDPANPTVIAPGDAVAIHVIGGFGPFLWHLDADGYHLAQSTTQARGNMLYADSSACGPAAITVSDYFQRLTGGTVRIHGPDFVWDVDRSPREFPEGDLPVTVFVSGGQPPYDWTVSEGFRLGCTRGCGSQNSLRVYGDTVCVADIRVTDACGSLADGFVRRQGYWKKCFTYKLPSCFVSKRCGTSPELDFGAHLVRAVCCRHGIATCTGVCDIDNWQYTAFGDDCSLDNPCEIPMVWALYIWHWVCY
jgi:hypothetical protein